MPSRAYTSFLRYPFKNLGFMRFSEPVFAGIYQNILTTAVFRFLPLFCRGQALDASFILRK